MSALNERLPALSARKRELFERMLAMSSDQNRLRPREPWTPEAPTTAQQRRMWSQQQSDPADTFANVHVALRLRGVVDQQTLARALEMVIRRHEGLRVTFRDADGDLLQTVNDTAVPVIVTDLRSHPTSWREERLAQVWREEKARTFDLTREWPIRGRLLCLGDRDVALFVTVHHIVMDGWARQVLVRELKSIYDADSKGHAHAIPKRRLHLPDYAMWQERWRRSLECVEQTVYWRRVLARHIPVLNLRGSTSLPSHAGFARGRRAIVIDGRTVDRLRRLAVELRGTLFVTLLGTLGLALMRLSSATEIVVGVPIAGRHETDLEGSVGLYTNAVPVRIGRQTGTIRELLARVWSDVQGAFAHQMIPIEDLIRQLRLPENPGFAPLFQVMFTVYNYRNEDVLFDGVDIVDLRDSPPHALRVYSPSLLPIDMCIGIRDNPGDPAVERRGFIEFNSLAISESTIADVIREWNRAMELAAAQPDAALNDYLGH